MPTRKTQTSCPNCRQPVAVEFEQLFDTNLDPEAKNRLLSGTANLINCPFCQFQGPYSTPIVYHDATKELLLTFVPPELGLPRDMQEKVVGPLITQAVNALPNEKRKGYLLQPKTMLTYQTLMETILEADGITKEMLQGQQQRVNLIQRLINTTSEDVFVEVAKEEDKLVDREFFALFSQLLSNAAQGGNEPLARRMMEVQQKLAEVSTYGKQVMDQQKEVEAAVASLQELGEQLTRENLLDLVIKAPNDTRVKAYVSLARGGMDYQFFQLLSDRVDRARSDGRARLATLREQLLTWTKEFDQRREAQVEQIRKFIDAVIKSENIPEVIAQNAQAIDELFVNVVGSELEAARKAGDLQRSGKLQEVLDALDELSAPPPEVQVLNDLIAIENPDERQALLEALPPDAVSAIAEALAGVMGQIEASGDTALLNQVQTVYKQVLKFSMRMRMKS
ncbi:MAG: hypothetical protein HC806_04105 [Anaerolineae bacterium]|nr:hypothetical protein [Anaerolineae bacterium]